MLYLEIFPIGLEEFRHFECYFIVSIHLMFLQYKISKVVKKINHTPLQHFQLWMFI